MEIEIEVSTVKALLLIAGNKDVRYYLCGVCFEPSGYAVATDGQALLAVRTAAWEGAESVIVPREALELAVKSAARYPSITVKADTVGAPGTAIGYRRIDGNFPEWRRVIPAKASGEVAQFNTELVARCGRAADLMVASKNLKGFHDIAHNGGAAALMHAGPKALIVLMPARSDAFGDVEQFVRQFLAPAA